METHPNHLQSLLKKKEIRKSLNTAKLKEARPAALRLAVLAMQYFTLLDKIRADVVRFGYKNSMQLANINGKFYDFTDTFWLDAEKSEENITFYQYTGPTLEEAYQAFMELFYLLLTTYRKFYL